jgi:1-phosphatidylinositol phosphodiesterase
MRKLSLLALAMLLSLIAISALSIDTANWMSSLPDNAYLYQLSIPGTHETMTWDCDSRCDSDCIAPIGPGPWTPTILLYEMVECQDLSLEDQLHAGIRAFDIRCKPMDGYFAIYHGDYRLAKEISMWEAECLTFGEDVLDVCGKFLKEHQEETIIMRIQDERTGLEGDFGELFETEYWGWKYTTEDSNKFLFYGADVEDPNPPLSVNDFTLYDVRGRVVVMQNFGHSQGKVFGLDWHNQQLSIQDDYKLNCEWGWDCLCFYWDRQDKWYNVRSAIVVANQGLADPWKNEIPSYPTKLFVNFLSARAAIDEAPGKCNYWGPPRWVADHVNPKCLEYLTVWGLNSGRLWRLGLMMMDFPTNELINAIIAHNKFPPVLDLGPLYEEVCASEFFNRLCTFTDDPGSSEWTITIGASAIITETQ